MQRMPVYVKRRLCRDILNVTARRHAHMTSVHEQALTAGKSTLVPHNIMPLLCCQPVRWVAEPPVGLASGRTLRRQPRSPGSDIPGVWPLHCRSRCARHLRQLGFFSSTYSMPVIPPAAPCAAVLLVMTCSALGARTTVECGGNDRAGAIKLLPREGEHQSCKQEC